MSLSRRAKDGHEKIRPYSNDEKRIHFPSVMYFYIAEAELNGALIETSLMLPLFIYVFFCKNCYNNNYSDMFLT